MEDKKKGKREIVMEDQGKRKRKRLIKTNMREKIDVKVWNKQKNNDWKLEKSW